MITWCVTEMDSSGSELACSLTFQNTAWSLESLFLTLIE